MGHVVTELVYIRLIYSHPQKWIHNQAYTEPFYLSLLLFIGPIWTSSSQIFAYAEEALPCILGAVKHHALDYQSSGLENCRNTMSNKDEGCSVSSDNGRETYVKICIIHIYIFAKSFHSSWSQYNSISNINCAAQIQTEHNHQYFKSRPSLRKCGCPRNLKLDRGVALE